MKEEKRISYQAGITRKPSDFLCQEGELAECINMTSDGEELKVLTPLSMKDAPGKKLLFVHKLPGGGENYIYEEIDDHDNYWLYVNDSQVVLAGGFHETELSPKNVTAIGKTLIVNMGGEIKYFLWNGTGYKGLGEIPSLSIKPRLIQGAHNGLGQHSKQASGNCSNCVEGDSGSASVLSSKREEYNTFIIGLYSKTLEQVARDKGFAKPFFVRAALEMYDGTFTQITNPILLWPTINGSSVGHKTGNVMYLDTFFYQMDVVQAQDYSEYQDIIRDVVIFVSDGINVYDTVSDQEIGAEAPNPQAISVIQSQMVFHDETLGGRGTTYLRVLKERARSEIMADIESTSIFYRLCSLGLQKYETPVKLNSKIDTHTLENLTTQEQLKIDDYYSRCSLKSQIMYAYNNRLNLAGVERGFFKGFNTFMPWERGADGTYHYVIYVRIKTGSGYAVVKNDFHSSDLIGPYFYYPDPRAERVTVLRDGSVVLNVALKEHGGLNGAYYLYKDFSDAITTVNDGETAITESNYISASNVVSEFLGSQLMQSEVNNPFTFLSSGYHQVGTGNIIGMAALTQALSQGQFGQYPLTVFTTEGIWGMSVDGTGLYTAAHPMSREVALESNPCITQTDGAIFFLSKKGLMVVAGSDVQCVSEQMNGPVCNTGEIAGLDLLSLVAQGFWSALINGAMDLETFRGYLESADLRIAYDYTDSRLLLVRSDRSWCWVYNIKDGSFSKMTLPGAVISVVNNYPDYLLQTSDDAKTLYSLYDDVQEEACADRVPGFLLTRPMKLAGPLAVSSLRELKHVGWWSEAYGSCVKTLLLASDDLYNWYVVQSRFGMAAKYWRMALFVKMQPRERLSGTIIRKEDRRTENLR